jgi:hypothetical protein
MDTNQHDDDQSADTGSSRPDDPAVVAAAAGKATPERSAADQRSHTPSQLHNRGPPLADDLAGDLLVGRGPILAFLVSLGMPEDTDVYYLKRAGHWPIGKTSDGGGGQLIASKRRLTRHAQKITAPQKTDAA